MRWLIALALLTALVMLILRNSARSRDRAESIPAKNPYHCVSIQHGWYACRAARGAGDKRYLSKDAPLLPLPDCNLQSCQCHYAHYEDRRVEERRSPFSRGSTPGEIVADRRGRDRRAVPHQYRVML